MSFASFIKSFDDYIGSNGRNKEEIKSCENELGLRFAPEYRDYLLSVGLASFDGTELTGICTADRLSVVSRTKQFRERFCNLPQSLYVVEETGIDDILVCQDAEGCVYEVKANGTLSKKADSLVAYFKA